jgi:hypothetical protein
LEEHLEGAVSRAARQRAALNSLPCSLHPHWNVAHGPGMSCALLPALECCPWRVEWLLIQRFFEELLDLQALGLDTSSHD